MSHRAPGGNLLCRLIGLGDLDRIERERNMRHQILCNRLYNRPHQFETPWRMPQGHNNRWNAPYHPEHAQLIQHGPGPNMSVHGRNAEVMGHYQPSTHRGVTGRRSRSPDVDDWTSTEVEDYWGFHAHGIRSFKRNLINYQGLHRDPPHSRRWWVREYHSYIMRLQGIDETGREQQYNAQYRHGGRQQLGGGHEDDDDDDDD